MMVAVMLDVEFVLTDVTVVKSVTSEAGVKKRPAAERSGSTAIYRPWR